MMDKGNIVKNKVQQIFYKQNEIFLGMPEPILSLHKNVAIVFHVFYIDVWEEINQYLKQLTIEYDLYVTVPENMVEEEMVQIFEDEPDARVFNVENRGRDVLPFLKVMSLIGTDTYRYICKLHTKKTGDSALGNVWRKLLYFDLLGTDDTVRQILSLFDNDPEIGMVTGKNTILDSERYDYGNTAKIDKLIEQSGFLFQDHYFFAGGTMFWIRPELLQPVMDLFESGQLVFESEKGQKDNTLAHALERFFGIILHVKKKKIIASPSRYSFLSDDILDEVSALVLSQQYVGEDIFISQKRKIRDYQNALYFKEKEVEKLHKISQSLRIKNRIKRLIPSKIITVPKKIFQSLKVLKNNPAVLKKVIFYLKQGEIGYLIGKIREKSGRNLSHTKMLPKVEPQKFFKRFIQLEYTLKKSVVDIVIPVYNGYAYLEALFDSLEKHTTSSYRLIIVNDGSPDDRVRPYLLTRLEKHPTAVFIDNGKNKGFVKSVNEAIKHCSDHFVILNTDTELPAFWLERLMYPIVHMDKIASTTPFTNAGQIASFPVFLEDNEIFEGMSVNSLDKVFRNVSAENFYSEIPTGVGFCMGVNYDLVQEIGFFDEEAFGKGYGEENDWCQRAIMSGYKNLLVPNLFVYHKHGGSFPSEVKKQLIAENSIKLLEKHPNYDKDVQAYIKKDPHQILRKILVIVAASKDKEGLHLIVNNALGGGASLYAKERLEKEKNLGKKLLYMTFDFYSNCYTLSFSYKAYEFDFSITDIDGVESFLKELTYSEVFVNSLVSFQETARVLALLKELSEVSNAELIVPVHDYYLVCPNYTLLNEDGEFCEVPSLERCKVCMKENDQEWKTLGNANVDVAVWRKDWQTLLETADRIVCFSNSSKEIVQKAYPQLDPTKIVIIPHEVKPLAAVNHRKEKNSDRVKVGVLGAINYAKGAGVLKELLEEIEAQDLPIDIVLMGEISEYTKSEHFRITGRYERENLPQLVEEEQIDIFLIPSICPETFSYTTQEIMMMEMPLMVFDIGAPAERVASYDKGIVLKKEYVDNIFKELEKLAVKRSTV